MTGIDFFDMKQKEGLNVMLDGLVMGSLVANYPEFVESYGHDVANAKMSRMFSRDWDRLKEKVWEITFPEYCSQQYAIAAIEDSKL
jgi:hypothetical protein